MCFVQTPDKNYFVKNCEEIFTECNILEKQDCYLLGDFNINLLHNGENIFERKGAQMETKVITFFSKRIFGFWRFLSCAAIDISSNKTPENTATLKDHVLTNSSHKITQSEGIEFNLSDHELIYCTRKTTKFKSNKHNEHNEL